MQAQVGTQFIQVVSMAIRFRSPFSIHRSVLVGCCPIIRQDPKGLQTPGGLFIASRRTSWAGLLVYLAYRSRERGRVIGAIAGDIIGSVYKSRSCRIKTKDSPLFHPRCHFTDDSVLTVAVAKRKKPTRYR
jgi:hypothetical protein